MKKEKLIKIKYYFVQQNKQVIKVMHRTTFLFFLVISYLAIAQNKYEKYLFVVNKDTLPYKLLRPLSKFSNNKLPLVLFFMVQEKEEQTMKFNLVILTK